MHQYRIRLLLFLVFTTIFTTTYSQIYATEELKLQAEKEDAEKRKRLGIEEKTSAFSEEKQETQSSKLKLYTPKPSDFKTLRIDPFYIVEKVTKAQKESTEKEVNTEFQKDNLIIDFEQNKLLVVRKETQEIYRSFLFSITDNTITLLCNCEIPSFIIKERTANQIIIEVPNQDKNAIFNFIYTLQNEN